MYFMPTAESIPPKDARVRLKDLPGVPVNVQPLVSENLISTRILIVMAS